jgi:hypothetical protein
MIAEPVKTLNVISCKEAFTKNEAFSQPGLVNESHFDKLFASLLDSMEAKRLLSKNNLSAMLHTIAGISVAR